MSAGFLQRFYSAFPGGTVNQLLGNGTISEAGGVLTVTTPVSTNCDWWGSSVQNAPIAWRRLGDLVQSFDTVIKCEARCYQFTSQANSEVWFVLWTDRNNAYLIAFGNGSIYVNRFYLGGASTVSGSAAVAGPTASPHTYRFYWNPTARPLFVQDGDLATTIAANEVQCWYRIGDAGSWVNIHNRQLEFSRDVLLMGMGCKNWSTLPANSSLWNYAGVYQWDAETQRMLPVNKPVSFS